MYFLFMTRTHILLCGVMPRPTKLMQFTAHNTAHKKAYHLSITIFTAIVQLEISKYSFLSNKYLPNIVKNMNKKCESCFNVTW